MGSPWSEPYTDILVGNDGKYNFFVFIRFCRVHSPLSPAHPSAISFSYVFHPRPVFLIHVFLSSFLIIPVVFIIVALPPFLIRFNPRSS
jgi:hypothetical protein